MQEFSSVTASSYDAESLAPMLTEKASEGWSVVSIISAGTNVVAYLTRGGESASTTPAVATAASGVAASEGSGGTVEFSDANDVVEIEVNEEAAAAVSADATAISPSLPEEDPPAEEPVVSSPEAVAAVEASGEPTGWGAVADTPSEPESPSVPDTPTVPESPTIPETDSPGFGAVAGGVGAVAGAAAIGGAVFGQESAGDTADSGDAATTDAAQDMLGSSSEAPAATTETSFGAAEHAGAAEPTDGASGAGLVDSIGDATSGAADASADVSAASTEVAASTEATTEATSDDAAAASGVPAGWYADPSGRFELRYWDGNAWTEHVSRAGQQYTDPPVA